MNANSVNTQPAAQSTDHTTHTDHEGGIAMNENMLYICKEAGTRKDAFRITTRESIPDFLRDTVHIDNCGIVHLTCVEGEETCLPGAVIGYEESESTGTGFNTWVIGNAATNLVEKDGVFYKKATVFPAMPMTDEFPAFLQGADITHNPDGSWSITTPWGKSTGRPGLAYWIRYGTREDGSPDANILTKTEKSYWDYFHCTQDGRIIAPLSEADPLV